MYTADGINAIADAARKTGTTTVQAAEDFQAVQNIAELCKPCAVKMSADCVAMKSIGGRAKKITCAKCGRRRFGVAYQFKKEGDGK